jgi:UDP-N-acetylmuramyl pentapeptide synthase
MKNIIKNLLTSIFRRQARLILKKHKPIVVAVVGSVGKTSTKLAIATVLKQTYRVQYQNGNYNVMLTLPLVISGQTMPGLYNPFGWLKVWLAGQRYVHSSYPYDVIVLEMGTDAPGDIIQFKKILSPDIAVVSGISEEHMEYFKSIDAVAKEEFAIAQFSEKLVINADDVDREVIKLYVPDSVEVLTYGFNKLANYKINATRNSHHSFKTTIHSNNKIHIDSDVMVVARHSLKPVGAAVAVADLLGVPQKRIQKGVNNIEPANGRMRIFDGKEKSFIIDDSYNASPLAVEAAVDALFEMHAPSKMAILGSMNELGVVSKTAHQHIGKKCTPDKLDLLITIGEQANNFIAAEAEANGCHVIRTSSPYKAGKVALQNITKPGTVILVKGSQNGVFSEEAVKQLLANPADQTQLVRQNNFWMTKKQSQFSDAS